MKTDKIRAMNSIEQLLSRGVEEAIVKEHLEQALKSGKKLRVKFGIDPTAPDLHLGHTVPLRKLRQFQDAGHIAVLIIGDFTAMIGDPTGRSEERKPLTAKEVKQNMKKYLKQAAKVIDVKKAEIYYNSKWFAKKDLNEFFVLARSITMQQVLHRADFKKRLEEERDISMSEVLYPALQGYDSFMVKANIEIGGTDQKFNLLMGRRIQRHFGMEEQDIMTLSLLEGTDGIKKMSKSVGNYIALDETPDDMFGKVMGVPDNLINKYFTLLTGEDRKIADPREAKLELGRILVNMYHGKGAGEKAQRKFIKVFSQHEKPENILVKKIENKKWKLSDLLVELKLAPSKSEARRLIEQGAVKINDEKKTDPNEVINPPVGGEKEILLQVGKRQFLKLHP